MLSRHIILIGWNTTASNQRVLSIALQPAAKYLYHTKKSMHVHRINAVQ